MSHLTRNNNTIVQPQITPLGECSWARAAVQVSAASGRRCAAAARDPAPRCRAGGATRGHGACCGQGWTRSQGPQEADRRYGLWYWHVFSYFLCISRTKLFRSANIIYFVDMPDQFVLPMYVHHLAYYK